MSKSLHNDVTIRGREDLFARASNSLQLGPQPPLAMNYPPIIVDITDLRNKIGRFLVVHAEANPGPNRAIWLNGN